MATVGPSSFSGPPMNMQRSIAYDTEALLPALEATGIDVQEAHLPPSQRSRPTSSARYQQQQQQQPAGGHPTPSVAGGAFLLQVHPAEEKQQASTNLVDHFPRPHPAAAGQQAATTMTPRRAPPPEANLTPRRAQEETNLTPRVNRQHRFDTPDSSSRAPTARAVTQQHPGRGAANPNAKSPTRRPTTSPSHGQYLSPSTRTGESTSMYAFGFPSPPISPQAPTSPGHRGLLAAQANQCSQTSTVRNHDTNLGPFAKPSMAMTPEQQWPMHTPAGRDAVRLEQQQRVDALIRLRMDQVARARAHMNVNILDSIYVNATSFLPDSPRARGGLRTEAAGATVAHAAKQLFDPLAKFARVQKTHEQARVENERLCEERMEREAIRADQEKQWERERLVALKKKKQERERIHDEYNKLQAERQARKEEQKRAEEDAERHAAEQRQREHEKMVEIMKNYHQAASPSDGAGGDSPLSRAERERGRQREEQVAREKEAARWERVQLQWRKEKLDLQAKKEAKAREECERREKDQEEKQERAMEARRARDDRIVKYMVSIQEKARVLKSTLEADVARRSAAEARQAKMHLDAREVMAEEARRKQAEKLQERHSEAERLMREKRDREEKLKRLASRGYRRAMTTHLEATSPRRRRSPTRTDGEEDEEPLSPSTPNA